ncbi:MAG: hypothetical protein SOZ02_02365 [Hallerella porci]|uniref:Uncharacterized protein n=1 Tax=Hallerella porci TaxID=1945871 RepID=A0ABX5LR47_9BACT|nr:MULTISPECIES: hypothetical protein [Hallerella]MCI5601605.1 hypothetical protein [Hallerella sp.]MDY3920992.1 hypothetical protein [Hallerella porci]PWL03743.1 hypothetical protein B0H50_10335 [Hallerella porci]
MFSALNFDFSFYDWLLIIVVTFLGTASAYLKDPQIKAVLATIPIPCGLAYIAVGLPIGTANAISALMCLLYVHIVRVMHDKMRIPIVVSIILGLVFFVLLGALLLPRIPESEIFFVGFCLFDIILGVIIFQKQTYAPGVRYKTPLPVYIKAPAIAAVVSCLMLVKNLMGGFCTSFPMINSIVSYECRFSLGDQCRQLPLFLIAAPLMFIEMHFIETRFEINHWCVLFFGYILFSLIYFPLNQELKRRVKRAKAPSPLAPSHL